MIEVTCAACGSTQRFPETDGGKMSSCAKCKARITVPRPLPSIPSPGSGGGTGDVINLSDLPAPKRPSPLGGARPPPSPMGGARKPPAPPTEMPTIDMDSIDMDSIDLPAPVGPESRGLMDLPAPVGPSSRGITDLPAPVGPSSRGITDLPAPVGPTPRGLMDLPAPVGPSPRGGGIDLPAPVGPTPRGLTDLPAPRGPTPRAATPPITPPITPPPARGLDPFGDLPAPKRGAAVDDGLDLLAPVAPTAHVDLPAPKGFFDDLPAPRGAMPTAPGELTPKLPTPKPSAGGVDLPAPKGFFDDLPAPRGATPTAPGELTPKPSGGVDLPAPKGFFDDLPGPRGGAASAPTATPAPKPRGLDLDDLDLAPPTLPPQPKIAPPTGAAQARTAGPMPLDLGSGDDVPPLELDAPSDKYGSLDLPVVPPAGTDPAKAQAAAAGGVSFKPGGGSSSDAATIHMPKPGGLDLEIDDTKRADKPGPGRVARVELPAATDKAAAKPKMDPKKKRILALAVLGVIVVGGGVGMLVYKKWKDQKNRVEQRDAHLADARRLLAAGSAKHWGGAANAAEAVLQIDGGNADALGIATQGYIAGYLEEGTNETERRKAADRIVDVIHARSARGAQVEKGLAIYGVLNNDAVSSIDKLTELAKSGKDPDASLYLGFAYAELRKWDDAIKAFSAAADAKNRAVPATYQMGLAQLAKGDLAAAKASFSAVNDLSNHTHLGAQVGIQATMPTTAYARRESELQSILKLKEIEKGDPRVKAWALTLAADDERRAGLLGDAKTNYDAALKLVPKLLGAVVGTAELALRDGRLPAAEDALTEALEIAPDDPDANLAMVDLMTRKGQPSEAETVLIKLRTMTLPYSEQKVRMHMLDGVHLEKLERFDDAVQAYADAQAASDTGDIGPAVAEATLLGTLATKARAAGQADQAAAYTARSTKLLDDLAAKAKDDPVSQLALGRAFLAAGDGAKAEEYLRKGLLARPDDIEASYQLVDALQLQGKIVEASAAAQAAFKLDPTRTELALKLAATLEEAGRFEDTTAMFEQLVLDPNATTNTRIKAGMFWARHGAPDKAGIQGDAIVKAEPKNAAGQYLQGEAAYALKKWDDARKAFTDATTNDTSQAIYFEALARTDWMSAEQGEPQYFDKALVAYEQASKLDPTMLSAQIGRGLLHTNRGEFALACEAYEAALALAPDDKRIPLGLGKCLQEQGRLDEALKWLTKAVSVASDAEGWQRIAIIYDKKNDVKKAAEAYRKATTLALQQERDGKGRVAWLTEALWTAGARLKDSGNERAACAAWDQYLSRDPQDPVRENQVGSDMLAMRCH